MKKLVLIAKLWRFFCKINIRRTSLVFTTIICLIGGQNVVYAAFLQSMGQSFVSKFQNDFGSQKGFSNFTAASANENGDGFYTGAVGEYRFSNNFSTAPWVDFEAPKLDAGCNGLSFNLGFAKLVDFDDIGSDIGNAAGAIVYGILIALINSLPTVNQILNQIKSLVQFIQNTLRNSCNFSQNLSTMALNNLKQAAKDKAATSNSTAASIANTLLNSQDYLDSATSKISSTLNDVKKQISKTLTGQNGNAGGSNDSTMSAEFIKVATPIFHMGFVPSILRDEAILGLGNSSWTAPKMVEIKSDSTFTFNSKKMQYLVIMTLLGDKEGMSNKEWNMLYNEGGKDGEMLKAFMDLMQNGKISKSKYPKFFDYFAQITYKTQKDGDAGSPPLDTSPIKVGGDGGTTFLKDLMYGKRGYLYIPTRYVVVAQLKAKNEQYYTLLRTLEATKSNEENQAVSVQWKGLVKESAIAQYCYFTKSNNLKIANFVVIANNLGSTTIDCTNTEFGLVAPFWGKFTRAMIEIWLDKQNSKTNNIGINHEERIKSLSKLLSLMNASSYLDFLLSSLQNTLDVETTAPDVKKGGQSADEEIRKTILAYKKQLDDEANKNIKDVVSIIQMLDDVNTYKKNEKSTMGGIGQ